VSDFNPPGLLWLVVVEPQPTLLPSFVFRVACSRVILELRDVLSVTAPTGMPPCGDDMGSDPL